jgi:N-acetylneuraminate lyase
MSGVNLSMIALLERAGERIPNLRGLKYTHNDLMEYQQCLRLDGGRFDVLYGMDELLLSALSAGAQGAVGSTYSYSAPIFHRLMEAFRRGDMEAARTWADLAVGLVQALYDFGGVPAGKAIMSLIGVECGPPRIPLRPLSEEDRGALKARLESLNVLEILNLKV